MAISSVKTHEIVDNAIQHVWSIPEFQRGFVWKTTQVRDLAESLWLGYPVGSMLLWNSSQGTHERGASDSRQPNSWVVDGQQRTTAFCLLFGRKPYWFDSKDWDDRIKKYDIRFDVADSKFKVADAIVRKSQVEKYIPISRLLNWDTSKEADRQQLTALVNTIYQQGFCNGLSAMDIYSRLDSVCNIRKNEVATITIDHDLEDVVKIFSLLNGRGTRVTEADIYLALVAARNGGWVKDHFLKHLDALKDYGFDIDPNLLFRSLTAIGIKKVRFKDIDDAFWNETTISPAWERTKGAWLHLISKFSEYGILSNNPMPTEAALVTMVALIDKFPNDSFKPALYWFIQASRFGRYSGSGTTALEEDLRDIKVSSSATEAINKLLDAEAKRFDHNVPFDEKDFLVDYSDSRFGPFLLYLLVYKNEAIDWDEKGHRIGYDGTELFKDFNPQWHHVFPKKFLEGKFEDDKINALANIAVIGPSINIRISSKDPMKYIPKYRITKDKLAQQFIDDDVADFTAERYESWLSKRALRLVREANAFLLELRLGIV